MKPSTCLLVGTGTGIGKTHVGCALLRSALARGLDTVGLKPIESGVTDGVGTDASSLGEAGGYPLSDPPYRFPDPVSPHLAARMVGATVDLGRVTAWVALHLNQLVLVETAGGLLTPLGPAITNLDLVVALEPDAVLVVSLDRLGVLHDVAAVLFALQSAGLRARAIALNAAEAVDASTGTNATELEAIHRIPVSSFPRSAPEAADTLEAASQLLDRLL